MRAALSRGLAVPVLPAETAAFPPQSGACSSQRPGCLLQRNVASSPVRPHATNPSSSAVRVWRRCSEGRFHVQTPTRIQETTTPRAAPPAPSHDIAPNISLPPQPESQPRTACVLRVTGAPTRPYLRPSLVHAEAAEGAAWCHTLGGHVSPPTLSDETHPTHSEGSAGCGDHHPCGRTVAR